MLAGPAENEANDTIVLLAGYSSSAVFLCVRFFFFRCSSRTRMILFVPEPTKNFIRQNGSSLERLWR